MARRLGRTGVGFLVAVFVLVGCWGGDAPEVDPRLGDIRDSEPPDPDPVEEPEPDLDEDPEQDPADDADGDADASESEAPDELGEDVASGPHIPESAFVINHELEHLDEDAQRRLLHFYSAAYAYTIGALDTGDYDDEVLASYFTAGELDGISASLRRYAEEGLRQVAHGVVTEYVTIDAHDGAGAIVHHCTRSGPDDGVIDIATGAWVHQQDPPHRLVSMRMVLAGSDDGSADWRLASSQVLDVDCS